MTRKKINPYGINSKKVTLGKEETGETEVIEKKEEQIMKANKEKEGGIIGKKEDIKKIIDKNTGDMVMEINTKEVKEI